jgi:hypothetical protein
MGTTLTLLLLLLTVRKAGDYLTSRPWLKEAVCQREAVLGRWRHMEVFLLHFCGKTSYVFPPAKSFS